MSSDCLALHMDDICVISKIIQEHLENFQDTFAALGKYLLSIKYVKCPFAMKEVTILGHKVTGEGEKLLHFKAEPVQKWPAPTNASELQTFLNCGLL